MTLKGARAARDRLRIKALDKQPIFESDLEEQRGILFRQAAQNWLVRQKGIWKPAHFRRVQQTVEKELIPVFGDRPIRLITAKEIAASLMKLQAKGVHDHAHDVRQRLRNIFRFAQTAGEIDHNPAETMAAVMAPIPRAKHQPALINHDDALKMVRDVESTSAHPIIKAAFRFSLLTALRQGEVRFSAWSEIRDLDGPEPMMIIPGRRMKGKATNLPPDHYVPLSRQAVELLQALRPMTGAGALIFPAFQQGEGSISENSVNLLIGRAGYKGRQTAHGLRSCFSSIMKKRNRRDGYVVDLMLGHQPPGAVASAYDRELYLDERRALYQVWADIMLEGAQTAAELLSGARRQGNGRTKIKEDGLESTR